MVAATVALFVVPLLLGAALRPTLLRAMTFMIVASPCAVVLATMPPLLSAIANAGRHGVLVKSAVVMEQLGDDDPGRLRQDRHPDPRHPAARRRRGPARAGLDRRRSCCALAAAAEQPSEHPLAARDRRRGPRPRADARRAARLHLRPRPRRRAPRVDGQPGRGRRARAARDRDAADGRAPAPSSTDSSAPATPRSSSLVDGAPVGVLGLADRPAPEAADAVAALTALTGARPVLLTGDNPRAAAALAAEVGITDVRAGLLPEDKVDRRARARKPTGPGRCSSATASTTPPRWPRPHTGVAMGRAGADLALDTADAVIVRDDLATIPAVIALSRRARRVVIANLVIAATVITALVAWDLIGHLPLPLGVAGHEGSTVIVGLNGLRLLRDAAWPKQSQI